MSPSLLLKLHWASSLSILGTGLQHSPSPNALEALGEAAHAAEGAALHM